MTSWDPVTTPPTVLSLATESMTTPFSLPSGLPLASNAVVPVESVTDIVPYNTLPLAAATGDIDAVGVARYNIAAAPAIVPPTVLSVAPN